MGTQAEQAQEQEKDLLIGTEGESEKEIEDAGDNGEEEIEEPEAEETPAIDLKEKVAAIQETLQEKAEKIEQLREDSVFLSKQIVTPDAEQFDKGGIYEDLPKWYLGQKLLYQASQAEIDRAIQWIENDPELSESDKRQKLRTIDKALAVFEDRKIQYQKQNDKSLNDLNVQEWQQVELGFKDPKTGIKGLTQEHIKKVWDWCVAEMSASRSVKARCDASFDAKLNLAVKAIRVLGIDKELGKDLSGEDRLDIDVPVGQPASRGTKRGASTAPTFTRKQLAEFAKNPAKVDEKLMAQINKAMAEGRIKDK
jgi:hypothetical protein